MQVNVNNQNQWRVPPDDTVNIMSPKLKQMGLQEVDDEVTQKKWKGMLLSFIVILVVMLGVLCAILVLGPVDEALTWGGKRLTLQEFLQKQYDPKKINGMWVSGYQYVYRNQDRGLSVFDVKRRTTSSFMSNMTFRQLNAQGYKTSSDLKYVLLVHDVEKVFRHSFKAHYTVFDVPGDSHFPLQLREQDTEPTLLQHVSWVGDTNALIMVYNNDIYLKTSPSSNETYRVTDTGQNGVIYNGIPDWLYEEEILDGNSALWVSADGQMFLYATFNDSLVGEQKYTWYGDTEGKGKSQYPEIRSVRYPKPGSRIPEVTLWVVDLSQPRRLRRQQILPPETLNEKDYYVTAVSWIDSSRVAVVWMNRAQKVSVVGICSQDEWICRDTHSEHALERQWVEMHKSLTFSKDGSSFLLLSSIKEGSGAYFRHIQQITTQHGKISTVTHGEYDVTEIVGWDNKKNLVYFMATTAAKPRQRHLYATPTDHDGHMDCLTCKFVTSNCTFFSASFSRTLEYYTIVCRGPELPSVEVYSAQKHNRKAVLIENSQLSNVLSKIQLPQVRKFEVGLQEGYRAQVMMLVPPLWREEITGARYPMVVEVDERHGRQSVTDMWELGWGSYLSSSHDVVYVKVDGRGAGGQGDRQELHQKLGAVELQDQLKVARYLVDTLRFIDRDQVAIWGWGYGGYITTLIMGTKQQIFKCGIAVAPVTDWLLYDSTFAERNLGMPDVNIERYVESDASRNADKFQDNSFYLIHGSADDNVHYQQSMLLAKALTKAGVLHRQQSYSDQVHDLAPVRSHLYRSMEAFLSDCFSYKKPQGSIGDISSG